jgi:hypothetical protein
MLSLRWLGLVRPMGGMARAEGWPASAPSPATAVATARFRMSRRVNGNMGASSPDSSPLKVSGRLPSTIPQAGHALNLRSSFTPRPSPFRHQPSRSESSSLISRSRNRNPCRPGLEEEPGDGNGDAPSVVPTQSRRRRSRVATEGIKGAQRHGPWALRRMCNHRRKKAIFPWQPQEAHDRLLMASGARRRRRFDRSHGPR